MNKCIMTPLQIRMLLHYYAIAEPYAIHEVDHANSPAVREQLQHLINWGFLTTDLSNPSGYTVTDKGLVYVEAICNIPLPVMKWEIPK